jgi:hypothetical protein
MIVGMDTQLIQLHRGAETQSLDERRKFGLAMRQRVPRSAQAEWSPAADRVDPVAVLIEQGKSRIQELLPVRYARMKADPFAFLRGAAAVMAADLAGTPSTGLRLQSCGDAHFANFGTYVTPEGKPVFDLNDFDETLLRRAQISDQAKLSPRKIIGDDLTAKAKRPRFPNPAQMSE